MSEIRIYQSFFKRPIDIIMSFSFLALLSPLLLMLAICIRLDSPGGVLFFQRRIGCGGSVFVLVKLRTMLDRPRKVTGEIVGAHADVTSLGQWLRRFKLDELPQLWNILRGDMSFVGPRPCLPEQVAELNEDGRWRLTVRPGLTGLAQVNGNIYLSWPQRWVFDKQYVHSVTLVGDVRILLKTFLVVLFGEYRLRSG